MNSMIPAFLQTHKEGVVLAIRVTPKASQSKIAGAVENELKVSLHAPPADGQANRELIRLLSKLLNIPKSQLEIIGGETSRSKRVLARGVTSDMLQKNLQALI